MRKGFLRGVVIALTVAGAVLFLKETWYIPYDLITHVREIITGDYTIPSVGEDVLYAFIAWGIATLVMFCLPEDNNGEEG